ncbi:hypothetical protein [Nocardia sp. NPDC051570]|uniref:hypothetical protein n=1 Tax=Nocardia sp. NPDC051570 TaxID=3364324 RepID=UPI00378B0081
MGEPWENLRDSANSGSYRIQVPDGIIRSAAVYVAEAITVLQAAADHHGGDFGDMTKFTEGTDQSTAGSFFGTLPSGILLAQAFTDKAGHLLNDLVPAYKQALDDLGEALIKGGRLMQDTDQFSAIKTETANAPLTKDKLDQITHNRQHLETEGVHKGQWVDDSVPVPSWANTDPTKPAKVVPDSKYKPGDPGTETVDVVVEPPDSLDYPTAMKLGDSLKGKPVFIADMGGAWMRMATGVSMAFTDLQNNVASLKTLGWEGKSADAANAAIGTLVGRASQLADAMTYIGQLLVDASGWTAGTVYKMPDNPNPSADERTQKTNLANAAFDIFYRPGVTEATVQPQLVPPTGIAGLPSNGPSPGGTSPGGDSPGGTSPGGNSPGGNSPGGTSPGGNSPGGNSPGGSGKPGPDGLTPQQRKQQQEQNQQQEKDRKDDIARQDEQRKEDQQRQDQQRKDDQQRQDQQRKEDQQRQDQQQQQQQQQQSTSQMQQMLQQGMQFAQQAVQQGLQLAQQVDPNKFATAAGLPPLPDLDEALDDALGGSGSGGGGGGGIGGVKGGIGVGTGSSGPREVLQASRLFPRASVTAESEGIATGRAGLAATTGGMGSPGGMGPAAHGAGNQNNKDRKRAEFLDSVEYLEEALGIPPVVAKPVVEK